MSPTVLRSRSHQILCLVGTAACAAFAAANLAVGMSSDRPGPNVVAAIVFIVLGILSVRFALASIVVDPARRMLTVRNPLRTYRIAFDDVDRFDLRKSWVPNTYRNNRQLLVVFRRGGGRLTMIGGCAPGLTAVRTMRDQVAAAVSSR
jgi:hypothetical protein